MMKVVLAVILLAGGLLLTPARCPAQSKTEINSERLSIGLHSNPLSEDQLTLGRTSVNATSHSASIVSMALPATGSSESASARQRAVEACGKFPLSFEANAGQADRQVRFLSRGPGYTLFLTSNEAVLVAGKNKFQVARVKLAGANPAPEIRGSDELSGRSFYFIGNDPKNWQSKVPNYAQVRYVAVYPGVDLLYYGNRQRLECDFVVAPKADPKRIRLSFPGARKIRIDRENGDLILDCVGGEVRFQKPIANQAGDDKTLIEARYVLKQGNQVGIAVGSYDVAKPLIIDPVFIFSTFLGGSGSDLGSSIAVDAAGNAYVTGITESPSFPTAHPLPAPNNALQGNQNAFVSKISFDSATSRLSLAYSAYLGGSGGDTGTGIAADADGNAYVTGFTGSANFPVVHSLPAPNNGLQGASTAFVSKLSFDSATSTLSLAYSSYLGGSGGDSGAGIAVDAQGNAYVTGQTGSLNFPTVHPLSTPKSALQGGQYAFVSKLSFDSATSKLSLVYSTYLGGSITSIGLSPYTSGAGIAVDTLGNAYVTGATGATDFPAVHSLPSPDDAFRGFTDVFVSKLSFDNATSELSLAYSTLLGGTFRMGAHNSGMQEGTGIAVDSVGNAYVIGTTFSSDFTVVNPLPDNGGLQGVENAFISKLSFESATSRLSLAYSTYLGGSGGPDSGFDEGNGIAVDSVGNAYVIGTTTSPDFPIVNPLPSPNKATSGYVTAFVGKLSFDSTTSRLSLAYSTFLGGDAGIQEGRGIAVDTSGNAYVTGDTTSPDYPIVHPLAAPSNALQGAQSVFVAKIGSGAIPVLPLANAGLDQTAHVGMLVTLDGSASSDPAGPLPLTYAWTFVSKPAGSAVKVSDPTAVDPTFTPDAVGDYLIQLVVTNAAGVSSLPAIVTISTVNSPPVADAGPDQAITVIGTVVHLNGLQSDDPDGQPITYQWSILSRPAGSKASLAGSTIAQPSFIADVHGDYTIQLIVKDSLGAVSKPAVVKISFNNVAPVADAGLNQSATLGETVALNGSGSTDANGDKLTYQWSVVLAPRRDHPVISHSTAEIASFVPDLAGTYVVQLIVNDGFVDSAPATVEIEAVRPGIELTREICSLQRLIAELAPKAFRHRKLQRALLGKLNAVLRSLRERDYRQALQQLENDILVKTNGCATAGVPDRNDWIIDCRDQSRVYPMLLNIILEVREGERHRGQNGER
jgi:hypothetical protein